jgi:hypothetical protein
MAIVGDVPAEAHHVICVIGGAPRDRSGRDFTQCA